MSNVAKEIVRQINTIDARAFLAWGAKEFVNMGDGLKFKTSGLVRWKGYVNIRYDYGTDLYCIDFFKIRGVNIIPHENLENVFVEDLVKLIDEVVG